MNVVHDKIANYGFNHITNFEVLTTFIPQLKAAALHKHFEGKFNLLMRATPKQLIGLGLTRVEANRICAINEIHSRMVQEIDNREKITTSKQIFVHLQNLINLNHEEFHVFYLNRGGLLIARKTASIGGVAGCIVDPKIIFGQAMELCASTIILAHNHPSGNTQPSQADIQITKKIQEGGKMLDVFVADHVIVAGSNFDSYYSFADEGMM